jgi:hypothetical protein
MSALANPPVSHGRRWGIISLVGVLVLAMFWSVLWWGLTQAANLRIDAWLVHERSLGRQWACSERNTTGFPFQISLNCDLPNLVGELAGAQVEAGLHGLRAVVPLYQPTQVTAEAIAPLTLNDGHGARLDLDWAVMHAKIVAYPAPLQHLSLSLERVDAKVATAELGENSAQVAHAALELQATVERSPAAKTYDLALRLEQAVIPVFDAWVGSSTPANLALNGTISQAEFADKGTAAEWLEHWRAAGGTFDIASMDLDKGDIHMSAHGQIHLDESHRPSGQLEAEFAGIEPLLNRLGVPIGAVRLGAFGDLLGGLVRPKISAAASAEKTHVKLTLDKGRLMLGPIPTIVLRPLY